MRVPTQQLVRALAQKRSRAGPSGERREPAPKRQAAPRPEPPAPSEPEVTPAVDPRADTPPEREAGEAIACEKAAGGSAARESSLHEAPPPTARDDGEGPSGAASPPPGRAMSSSPQRTDRDTAGAAGGSGTKPRPYRGDERWAERVISAIFMPEMQEELYRLKASSFFREAFAALIKVANTLAISREVIHGGKGLMRETQQEADEARVRAETAEKALESAKDRAVHEAARLRAALHQMMEAESKVEARDLHIAELTAAVGAAERQAREAEGLIAERDLRVEELSAAVQAAERRAQEAERRAAEIEERAEYEISRSREVERAAVESLAVETIRANELEAGMEARAAQAVEEYKASKGFMAEMAEASTDAFLQGFQYGKEKVARDLDFPRALEVEPESLSELGPDDDEPPPAQP